MLGNRDKCYFHSNGCIHPAIRERFVWVSKCCRSKFYDIKVADNVRRKRMQPIRKRRTCLIGKQLLSSFPIHRRLKARCLIIRKHDHQIAGSGLTSRAI